MEPDRNTVISWEFLDDVRETERARDIIGPDDSPWARLFSMTPPAHREITVEMYSTFIFTPRAPGAPEPVQEQIVAGAVEPEVSFRLFGEEHRMSLERFAVHTGLYTEEQTHQPIYTEAVHEFAVDELRAWWPAIGDDPFTADSRGSDIRDPLYRYLHRLIATSITGRGNGQERCTVRDLFYLRCLLTHTPCHLARGLADYFAGYFHRQVRGALLGGNFVTRIAQSLGHLHDLVELPSPPIEVRVGGRTTATGMRIAKRGPDGLWHMVSPYGGFHPFVPVPLVDPPPFVAQEMHLEEVVEPAEPAPVDPAEPAPAEPDPAEPAPFDPGAPPPPPPPPVVPQHPPRVYTVVRLPRETQAQLDAMSAQLSYLTEAVAYLIRVDDQRRAMTGLSVLGPGPPVYRPFGHPGASTSGGAGTSTDAGTSAGAPGSTPPVSTAPGADAPVAGASGSGGGDGSDDDEHMEE